MDGTPAERAEVLATEKEEARRKAIEARPGWEGTRSATTAPARTGDGIGE